VRFAQLIEQPHVLDRDHRLVGEGRHQLDLLLRYGFTTGEMARLLEK